VRQRVALIGLGAIGTSLAELVAADPRSSIELVGALVRDAARPRAAPVGLAPTLSGLLALRPDVVAEAAGHAALASHGPACLRAGIPLVLLSVGALADAGVEAELRQAALAGGVQAIVASGGVGALDMIASAAQSGLERVVHRIVKPPRALGLEVSEYTEVFRGRAREAALRYPQNANVAAAVALAGVGLERSEVVLAADPEAAENRQEIELEGSFGRLRVEIRNRPSATNPRTSAVVAMSLKHSLEKLRAPIAIG
jgi:aspartate dehydrogenase